MNRGHRNPAPPSTKRVEGNIARLAGGAGVLLVGGAAAYMLSLAFSVLVARHFSQRLFGGFTLSVTVAILLAGLAPLGTDRALVRFVAIYRGRSDLPRVRGTIRVGVLVTSLVSVAFMVAVVVAAPLIAGSLFHVPDATGVLRIVALSIPCTAVTDLLLSGVQAHTRVTSTALITSYGGPGLRLLGGVAALAAGRGVLGVAAAYTAAEAATLAASLVVATRVFPGRGAGRAIHPAREIMRFSWPLAANQVVLSGNVNTEIFFLGLFNFPAMAGMYAAARRYTQVGSAIFTGLGAIFSPMISDLHAASRSAHLERLYKTVSRWVLTIGLPVFLIELIWAPALLGIFGPNFRAATTALRILAAAQLVNLATGATVFTLVMIGRSRLTLVNGMTFLTLSVVLDVALIPRFGLTGAACASAVSFSISNVVQLIEVWVVSDLLPFSMGYLRPIVAGAAGTTAALTLRAAGVTGKGGAIACAVVLLLVYGGVLALMGLDDSDRVVVDRLASRLRLSRAAPR